MAYASVNHRRTRNLTKVPLDGYSGNLWPEFFSRTLREGHDEIVLMRGPSPPPPLSPSSPSFRMEIQLSGKGSRTDGQTPTLTLQTRIPPRFLLADSQLCFGPCISIDIHQNNCNTANLLFHSQLAYGDVKTKPEHVPQLTVGELKR